jgi:hypothetical protein
VEETIVRLPQKLGRTGAGCVASSSIPLPTRSARRGEQARCSRPTRSSARLPANIFSKIAAPSLIDIFVERLAQAVVNSNSVAAVILCFVQSMISRADDIRRRFDLIRTCCDADADVTRRFGNSVCSIRCLRRSAIAAASIDVVCGSRTANSSPPYRAATSSPRRMSCNPFRDYL